MLPRQLVVLALTPALLGSQTVRVVGRAVDSLSGRPLASAFLSLGPSKTTFSDSAGFFVFDSVAAGAYRLTLQHDALDAIGLNAVSANVTISNGRDTVRVGTPSFATIWRAACGGAAPRDTGFVFGIARDALTQRPLAAARVGAYWTSVAIATPRTWRLETQTDEKGNYALCGVPVNVDGRLAASMTGVATPAIELRMTGDTRIQRQDLALVPQRVAPTGGVAGVVTLNGRPVADVRVIADGQPEAITDRDGRFALTGIPIGTRQVYAIGVPYLKGRVAADITSGGTARVSIPIAEVDSARRDPSLVRTTLAAGFDQRRRLGVGVHRDSTTLGKAGNFFAALVDVDGVIVQRRPNGLALEMPGCGDALLYLDGVRAPNDILLTARPSDLTAFELYGRGQTPVELRAAGIAMMSNQCAALLWTKKEIK